MTVTVRWAELRPAEFENRLAAQPVVYLPMGYANHMATWRRWVRFGGIVAPTQGYHIHETGYHAPFL